MKIYQNIHEMRMYCMFQAETKAYPDIDLYQKPEEVALWIIILAACAGILLLILLIIVLWKVSPPLTFFTLKWKFFC